MLRTAWSIFITVLLRKVAQNFLSFRFLLAILAAAPLALAVVEISCASSYSSSYFSIEYKSWQIFFATTDFYANYLRKTSPITINLRKRKQTNERTKDNSYIFHNLVTNANGAAAAAVAALLHYGSRYKFACCFRFRFGNRSIAMFCSFSSAAIIRRTIEKTLHSYSYNL